MKLGLIEYFKYLCAVENSRCVSEGEAVFDAGHDILCGRMTTDTDTISIFALCLQSSALSSEPHEITGVFHKNNDEIIIKSMLCSCKAGKSGKCKHISAVLLFCIRKNVDDLELLSKTDIKCMWSARRTTTRENYKAVPIKNMPCLIKKFVPPSVLQSTDTDILNKFANALPNSALEIHRKGRRNVAETNAIVVEPDGTTQNIILNNACQSIIMLEISVFNVNLNNSCCKNKYKEIFNEYDNQSIFFLNQHSTEWFKERKYRITGSRVYEIYTYSQHDWRNKALKYFYPQGFINKFTKHGIQYERKAREEFAKKFNKRVVEIGMVVSNSNIWLGFSADGVIFEENHPTALLEIKCLFSGATSTIKDAINTAPYLDIQNDHVQLKKKHKYYGQVQLGMAILNVPKCFFIIYASFDNSFVVLEIPFDYKFTETMLQRVKQNYFLNMIPLIYCNM